MFRCAGEKEKYKTKGNNDMSTTSLIGKLLIEKNTHKFLTWAKQLSHNCTSFIIKAADNAASDWFQQNLKQNISTGACRICWFVPGNWQASALPHIIKRFCHHMVWSLSHALLHEGDDGYTISMWRRRILLTHCAFADVYKGLHNPFPLLCLISILLRK